MSETWQMVFGVRAGLIRDLQTLTESHWQTPSLCEGWTVEDVLAHLTMVSEPSPARRLAALARAGFDFHGLNERGKRRFLGPTPADTLARFARLEAHKNSVLPPAALAMLPETLIHAEDMRRPLGIRAEYDPTSLERVARIVWAGRRAFDRDGVTRGLHLRATDTEFAAGSGPVVEGPTVALIMTMAGRGGYTEECSGLGAKTLQERMAGQ